MAAEAKHRAAIVGAAIGLFRKNGYSATGMNDIVAESGAPKGSLYHYFPGGKAEIGAAAVTVAGEVTLTALQGLAAQAASPAAFIRGYFSWMGGGLERSGFRMGCPLATVLLETAPQDARMAAAGRAVFAQWAGVVAGVLARDGVAEDAALRLGSLAVSAIEGALLQARVAESLAPLEVVEAALGELFAAHRK